MDQREVMDRRSRLIAPSIPHGLCRLNIARTKECNKLSLPKVVLLRVVVVWDAIYPLHK